MGKITQVHYGEIPEKTMSVRKAAEFYYHSNVYSFDIERFSSGYENYEKMNMEVRYQMIGDVMKSTGKRLDVNSSSLGISSLGKKVVIMANIA